MAKVQESEKSYNRRESERKIALDKLQTEAQRLEGLDVTSEEQGTTVEEKLKQVRREIQEATECDAEDGDRNLNGFCHTLDFDSFRKFAHQALVGENPFLSEKALTAAGLDESEEARKARKESNEDITDLCKGLGGNLKVKFDFVTEFCSKACQGV